MQTARRVLLIACYSSNIARGRRVLLWRARSRFPSEGIGRKRPSQFWEPPDCCRWRAAHRPRPPCRPLMSPRRTSHRLTKSRSARKNSLTSAWGRSTFSTRKTPESLAPGLPDTVAADTAVAEAAADAAAGTVAATAAAAVAGAAGAADMAAGAGAAAVAAAACPGAVATSVRSECLSIAVTDEGHQGRVRLTSTRPSSFDLWLGPARTFACQPADEAGRRMTFVESFPRTRAGARP